MIRQEKKDARMVKPVVRPQNKISAEELRTRLKLKSTRKCLQDGRLPWFVI